MYQPLANGETNFINSATMVKFLRLALIYIYIIFQKRVRVVHQGIQTPRNR